MAETCVEAARELIRISPDQPDTTFIYSHGPWCGKVHISEYFMFERAFDSSERYGDSHAIRGRTASRNGLRRQPLEGGEAAIVKCIEKMIR